MRQGKQLCSGIPAEDGVRIIKSAPARAFSVVCCSKARNGAYPVGP